MAWSMTPRACAATSQNSHPNASKSSLYRRDRGLKLKQKSLIICASDLPSHWICMYIASFIFPFFKIKKAQTYFIWYEERKVSSIHMQYSNNNLEYREKFKSGASVLPPHCALLQKLCPRRRSEVCGYSGVDKNCCWEKLDTVEFYKHSLTHTALDVVGNQRTTAWIHPTLRKTS